MAFGSAFVTGNSIYSFGSTDGHSSPIQRLDMATDGTIEGVELIGSQDNLYYFPILFITDADTCVTN
jgi:hypothetical protein